MEVCSPCPTKLYSALPSTPSLKHSPHPPPLIPNATNPVPPHPMPFWLFHQVQPNYILYAHPSACSPCRAVPCRAVPCRAVPCRAVPCRAVPCFPACLTNPTIQKTIWKWLHSDDFCCCCRRPSKSCICLPASPGGCGSRVWQQVVLLRAWKMLHPEPSQLRLNIFLHYWRFFFFFFKLSV